MRFPIVLASSLFACAAWAGPEVAGAAPPPAFVEMFVAGVVPSDEGHTLVLVNPDEQVLLPVGIGLSEAVSIHGRLEHRRSSRPLTHDLLDGVLEKLGGQVVRVQIDDMRDDMFVGTVFIKTQGRIVALDARPSDAVALAIGSRAPIFVARPVVERAALHADELEQRVREMPTPQPDGVLSL